MTSIMTGFQYKENRIPSVRGTYSLTSIDTSIIGTGNNVLYSTNSAQTINLPSNPSANQAVTIRNGWDGLVLVVGAIGSGQNLLYISATLRPGASVSLRWNGVVWEIITTIGIVSYSAIQQMPWVMGTLPFVPYGGNHQIAFDGTKYVYIGSDPNTGLTTPAYSINGYGFYSGTPIPNTSYGGTGIANINWNGVNFFATGGAGTGATPSLNSTDGSTWNVVYEQSGGIGDIFDFEFGAGVYSSGNYDTTQSSLGLNWTSITTGNQIDSVCFSNGRFVSISRSANTVYIHTPNTSTISMVIPSNVNRNYRIILAMLDGSICLYGNNGYIAQSFDGGYTWAENNSGMYFTQVIVGNGKYFALDSASRVFSSLNGLSWSAVSIPTMPNPVVGIMYTNGLLIMDNIGNTAYFASA